ASMLRSHSDEQAIGLLRELTRDASPAVVAAAVQSLTAIDPAQVALLADDLLGHADPSVRRATVRAVVQVTEPASTPRLGRALNDTDVNARHLARQALVDWADDAQLAEPVRQTLRQVLD